MRQCPVDLGVTEVRRTAGGGLEVTVGADRNPAIIRALVAADIDVHEIRSTERTLEEVFFEMTSREEVAA